MIHQAIHLAVTAHAGQCRKDGNLPYIVHPMEVLRLLERWGITDEAMWAAAVCHDILEDCPQVPHDVVADTIGPDAMSLVLELTRVVDPRLDIPKQKANYLASWIGAKSIRSLVIKLADRICNTKDFGMTRPEYARKYWEKAQPIFDALGDRYEELEGFFGRDIAYRVNGSRMSMRITMMSLDGKTNPIHYFPH
jgi:(p)ppGpp synthase/HD superfamily hydrolase